MCQFFSCIILSPAYSVRYRRGPVVFTEHNDHSSILDRLGIECKSTNRRSFVHIECKDGYIENYVEDETDTLPQWYIVGKNSIYLPRVTKILEQVNQAKQIEEQKYIQLQHDREALVVQRRQKIFSLGGGPSLRRKSDEIWEQYYKDREELGEKYDKEIVALYSAIEGYVPLKNIS